MPAGSTENVGPENKGPMRDQIDQRLIDTTGKCETKFPGYENAGPENVGPENAGVENAGLENVGPI